MRSEAVLVTGAGSVVGQGIIKCLKLANANGGRVRYSIAATDASPLAAGLYRGDAGFVVPMAGSRGYVSSIIRACRRAGASAIFVGSDEELLPLAKAKGRVEKETGAKVVVNPVDVLERCADKWLTYVFLKGHGFPAPRSAVPEADEPFYDSVG
ncbi:MAG: carbamoyl-phosphate synthase large subunit, partial [Nitrososphaerota archaeon]|nr:carbamoyl-phosphate synthase large subunit [Nitrososphaerota archaeon]